MVLTILIKIKNFAYSDEVGEVNFKVLSEVEMYGLPNFDANEEDKKLFTEIIDKYKS